MNAQKILYDMLSYSAPIILCVLGGNFAHSANVLNIALEGMMLVGAFVSVLVVLFTGNVWLGILVGVLATMVFGLIFSYLGVTRRGNVIIAGLAINLLAASVAAFVLKAMDLPNLNANSMVDVAGMKIHLPLIESIPFLGPVVSGHPPLTYVAFLGIAVMTVVMYRTRFGVYVRVVGEAEDAALSVGINGNRIKYLAVLIGAVCCALAGANLALEKMALFTNGMTAGIGFIAIAAIFCGRGRPGLTSIYAIVFGLAQSLAINLNLSAGPISGLFNTIPYFMIIGILTVVSILQHKDVRVRGLRND
ncbi:MAG: ABC transporter permease [Propionicimonas sp.]|jgi:simple sugar transport system permease protein